MVAEKYLETKRSTDEIEYPCLKIADRPPVTIPYNLENYSGRAEMMEDGYRVYHLYLKCEEIKEQGLPLDANPREPSQTKQVEAMQETLSIAPSDFVKKNNGVVLFASDVEISNDKTTAEVTFSSYEGVCNGGHTYFAITTLDELSDEAIVHLETIILPDGLQGDDRRKTIIDIAGARNNNNRLEQRSEADFLGYYNEFKEILEYPRMIQWHEGDSKSLEGSFGSVQFIRILKSMDPFAYFHPVINKNGSTHKSLSVSKNRPHSRWIENMDEAIRNQEPRPLHYLLPVTNDIFYLRDLVSYSLQWDDVSQGFRRSNFYQKYIASSEHTERGKVPDPENLKPGERRLHYGKFEYTVGLDLKETMEVLFLGLFRSNLYLSPPEKQHVKYSGWYVDPKQIWMDRKEYVLDQMVEYFGDVDDDPKKFIRITAPFSEDLFELGYQREPPAPEILYERGLENHIEGLPYPITRYTRSEEESEYALVRDLETDTEALMPADQVVDNTVLRGWYKKESQTEINRD